jgi:hypothetical protein
MRQRRAAVEQRGDGEQRRHNNREQHERDRQCAEAVLVDDALACKCADDRQEAARRDGQQSGAEKRHGAVAPRRSGYG